MTTIARNTALSSAVSGNTEFTELQARIAEMEAAKSGNGGNLPDNLKSEWQTAHDRKNALSIAAAKTDAIQVYNLIILANTPGSSDEKTDAVLVMKIGVMAINHNKGREDAKTAKSTRDRAGAMVSHAIKGNVLGVGSMVVDSFLAPLARILAILPPAKCDNVLYSLGLATGKTIKGDGLENIKADLAAYSVAA